MNKKLLYRLLKGLLIVSIGVIIVSCSSDNDSEPLIEQPADVTGATIQITVMFAPGQLGDKGYADAVMEGVIRLQNLTLYYFSDSLDVSFISPLDMNDAKSRVAKWAENYVNPFFDCTYERRLLVLTEPFMVKLIPFIQDHLRPTDELLFLKTEEKDIEQIAQQFSLGKRVHGLNISASVPVRNYCKYILRWLERSGGLPGVKYQIPVFRLYESDEYPYRDGMMETMQQELGDHFEFIHISLSGQEGGGIYENNSTQTILEAAFTVANMAEQFYQMSGCPYNIVDLGAGNYGWDYYLMGKGFTESDINTLMLDAKESPRLNRDYIDRHFDRALIDWAWDWMHKPVGEMDTQVTHYDSYYYDTFIFDIDELH